MCKGTLLPEVVIGVSSRVQRFGDYTMDGVGNSTINFPSVVIGGGGFNAFDLSKWFLSPVSLVYD